MHANEDDGFLLVSNFDEVIMKMRMQIVIGKMLSEIEGIVMKSFVKNQVNLHPFIGNDPVVLKLMPLGLNGGFCRYGFGSSNGR